MITVPSPDLGAEPAGFVVEVTAGERIHFLDWGGVGSPGVVLVHGLSGSAWVWTPVARRLRAIRRTIAVDLPGHGLSDAPTDGYDPAGFAADTIAAAEGAGLLAGGADRVVLAGHGFGGIVAAWTAAELGERCAALVLVDGGWESLEAASGMDVEEFLRNLDEPPEVLRSMDAFVADRVAFDPASWDADQERAARASVVETHAGRVVPATRPHALEASVRAMFRYDPLETLPRVEAPITAMFAGSTGEAEGRQRARALAQASAARVVAGQAPIELESFGQVGHNLMRYRPDAVTAAILAAGGSAA